MIKYLFNNKFKVLGCLLFLIIYLGITGFYSKQTLSKNIENIKRHASIISYDIWSLNDINLNSYINLAVNADDYQSIQVNSSEGDLTAEFSQYNLSGIDNILYKIGLISTEFLSAEVYFEDHLAGVISGYKYNKNIYLYLNIFVLQLIIFLTSIFFIYLAKNRKNLQKEVLDRTKKYYDLVNHLPETVIETDENGWVVYANKIALKQFGISGLDQRAFQCRELLQVKSPELNHSDILSLALNGSLVQTECTAKRIDGSNFQALVSSSPIFSKGSLDGASFVIIDITERLSLEDQLNRDQKMKSIGLMASGVAHDLNNTLSGIVSYPELILLKYPENDDLRELVEPMRQSGLQAAAVVSDLLTVARGIAAVKEIVNINDLINDYVLSSEFKHLEELYPHHLNIKIQLDPDVKNVSCSEPHVRKCLTNLLMNAAEALSGKGEIIVSTKQEEIINPSLVGPGLKSGLYSVLSVQDNGPGISPKHVENIFEPFYSKKKMGRSGTGLGLTIIWNVMEDHEGIVKLHTDDDGTTFELYFPSTTSDLSSQIDLNSGDWQKYKGKGEKILVVDDEPHQRDIASQLLKALNYKVQSVPSGEEAIEFLKESSVDCIMLDMIMGAGLNGRETYEQILKTHPTQKAIVVSGFSESDDVRKTIELGADRLLLKPYTIDSLAKDMFQTLN